MRCLPAFWLGSTVPVSTPRPWSQLSWASTLPVSVVQVADFLFEAAEDA
jgi:hypothetical protein